MNTQLDISFSFASEAVMRAVCAKAHANGHTPACDRQSEHLRDNTIAVNRTQLKSEHHVRLTTMLAQVPQLQQRDTKPKLLGFIK